MLLKSHIILKDRDARGHFIREKKNRIKQMALFSVRESESEGRHLGSAYFAV